MRFTYDHATVYVNHDYVSFIDREWGPGFLNVCGYAPHTMKLRLNGHEWATRQVAHRGIAQSRDDLGSGFGMLAGERAGIITFVKGCSTCDPFPRNWRPSR